MIVHQEPIDDYLFVLKTNNNSCFRKRLQGYEITADPGRNGKVFN